MFDALKKTITEVNERDQERLQKRKSRRQSTLGLPLLAAVDSDVDVEASNANQTIQLPSVEEAPPAARRITDFSDIEEDEEELKEGREKWANEYIVIIHMIGFAVGGSNVWGFGYLCYNYGGIFFMIPYLFLTLVCALPCVYLELLIGQFAQVGAIAAWRLAPLFKGVGMSMVLLSFMTCFNVQAILAWCFFYVFQATFHHPLPWISCDNGFGKKPNGLVDAETTKWIPSETIEDENKNWHTENCTEFVADVGEGGSLAENERLPGTEYFRGRVQRMWKSGLADRTPQNNFSHENGVILLGINSEEGSLEYNLDTLMCLLFVVFLIKLLITWGIRINSKVMLYLVLIPYLILFLLFYRATGLPGALLGLKELLKPDAGKLLEAETWWRCAEQVFYGTGAGFGMHMMFGSHNKFNRKIVYDAAILVTVNSFTSVMASCTIFMYLGHVSVAVNREIKTFVRSGPELVFEVMSDVLGVLANANFYAFCFYLFLFLISLSTVITTINAVKHSYLEILPVTLKYRSGFRFMLMAMIMTIGGVVASLSITRGGLHTHGFINSFVGLYSTVLSALLFMIGSAWCFGLREIVAAAEEMQIRLPGWYFQICWKFIDPIVLFVIFVGLLSTTSSTTLMFDHKEVPLNGGMQMLGYMLAIGPCAVIVGAAIHSVWQAPGETFKQKLILAISPTREHQEILDNGTGKRAYLSHYLYFYAPTGEPCNIFCSLRTKTKVAPEIQYDDKDVDEEKKGVQDDEKGTGIGDSTPGASENINEEINERPVLWK